MPDFHGDLKLERLAAARAGSQDALGRNPGSLPALVCFRLPTPIGCGFAGQRGASDLVQETFLEARRDFYRFVGNSEAELMAWLPRLLLNNMANFVRSYRDTAKRSVGGEVGLDSVGTFGTSVWSPFPVIPGLIVKRQTVKKSNARKGHYSATRRIPASHHALAS